MLDKKNVSLSEIINHTNCGEVLKMVFVQFLNNPSQSELQIKNGTVFFEVNDDSGVEIKKLKGVTISLDALKIFKEDLFTLINLTKNYEMEVISFEEAVILFLLPPVYPYYCITIAKGPFKSS